MPLRNIVNSLQNFNSFLKLQLDKNFTYKRGKQVKNNNSIKKIPYQPAALFKLSCP